VGRRPRACGWSSARAFLHQVIERFHEVATIPSVGIAAPDSIPGIGWSDHWSHSHEGFPAVMVTDTAPYRNPNDHRATDTPDTLDYERLTRVVSGLEVVLRRLVDTGR
jgi:hypothetical protein